MQECTEHAEGQALYVIASDISPDISGQLTLWFIHKAWIYLPLNTESFQGSLEWFADINLKKRYFS